jgi:hypothetical protein
MDKQRSTNYIHVHKSEDRVTQTQLKTGDTYTFLKPKLNLDDRPVLSILLKFKFVDLGFNRCCHGLFGISIIKMYSS